MKKLAKLLALAMALVLCLGMLAACTNNGGGDNDDGNGDANNDGAVVLEIMEGGSLAPEEYGIGFRKEDTELRDIVNAALKVLKADGTLATISTNWFGSDITTIAADAAALDAFEDVEEREFILGLDVSFPPMGYYNDQNEIIGFDIDVANAVCEKLGWTLKLQPIDWNSKEMELDAGNIDCIWNGMTLTEERLEAMSCSDPYMKNEQVLVVVKGSGYTTLDSLAGKIVALQAGSSAEEALDGAAEFKASLDSVTKYPDNLTCFMDLEQGSSDAVLVDSIVAGWYIQTGNAG